MRAIRAIAVIALAACAGKTPPPKQTEPTQPVQTVTLDSVIWNGDEDLAPILRKPELNNFVLAGAERTELRLGPTEFADRLANIAEDTTAPWLVRVNALKLLAGRGVVEALPVFVEALNASDERVRITAVTTMKEFMAIRQAPALDMLEYALKNPNIRVQTAALQILSDRDVNILRDFKKRTTNTELQTVTTQLIRVAEERGAPLLQKDSLGTLERTTSTNIVVTFKPTQRWPQWDASVGDLYVTLPAKKPVPLLVAKGVEQVGSVVPAFVTSDGKLLVYELNREIHVWDLTTKANRKLAEGIAPRLLPFTTDVLYLREVRGKRSETPNSFGLKYDVLRQPLATSDTAKVVGQIGARALNNLKGNYASVRWMRIREDEGVFYLVGDNIDTFKLPNPFGE